MIALRPHPRIALLAVFSVLLALGPTASVRASEPQLTFDTVFADDASGRRPEDLTWSPDGTRLAYRWSDTAGEALWVLPLTGNEAGRARAVLRLADVGEDFEIDALRWSPDSRSIVLAAGGDLHLLPLEAGELRRLTETEAAEKDPKFSPDGKQLAFVRGYDLHLMDLATGEVRALTEGGEEGETLNGVTDWVYWEELWGRDSTGFWWSPDGGRIAYYQFDETPVEKYPLVNFLPVYPQVEWQRYPKAGTANPRVRVGVLDLASGETTWLATGDDPTAYLARVFWNPADGSVAVLRLNRDQNLLEVLFCAPDGGACRPVAEQSSETWVNLEDDFAFLPDGRFIWGSEETGWRQLYLHERDGSRIRALTRGTQAVTSLEAVSSPHGWVAYTTTGPGALGAAERRVQWLRLNGPEHQELGRHAGWEEANVAPQSGFWVHTWSDADHVPQVTVEGPNGRTAAQLPSAPPAFDPAALPGWEMLKIPGPEGVPLPARMLKPVGFDPARKYPVIMYHYGCPASQVVVNRWEGRGRGLWHKMMAERGYVVIAVDNVGSIFFGKAGEDQFHRRFGPLELAAQLAAVDYLEAQPWVDADRIGLWGWSGGGANTLYNLLSSPGTWAAGVAGAPVTDWHLYDTIWTERYLDHPSTNEEGYRASSPATYAEGLEDPLLIVHGTGDDNVHPQNTIVMSQALITAGKPFEQAIYPRQKHGFRGASLRHFFERMTRFFDRELAPKSAAGERAQEE